MKYGIKRTLKEIIEFPAISTSDDIYDFDACLRVLNDLLYGTYLDIDYESDTTGITVETKIDVTYDCRRGAICQVLKYNDKPILIYMGAGRELEDTTSIHILDIESCKNVLETVRKFEEEFYNISNLEDEVELLYWEGIPVDLGDKGRKE